MDWEKDWQGLLVYALIGAASAFFARRIHEWYKAYKSKPGCKVGCGCGDQSKHS